MGCGRLDFTFFHATGEANRWATLQMLERIGQISELQRQVKFPLYAYRADGARVRVANYVADFTYLDDKGVQVIEDFKGAIEPMAILKIKWMEAMGLSVTITKG